MEAVVAFHAIFSFRFRAVERAVGGVEERLHRLRGRAERGDADAQGGVHDDALVREAVAVNPLADLLGDGARRGCIARRQERGELVAAEAGRDAAGAQRLGEQAPDLGDRERAERVAVRVVDGLQVVEVQHQQRQLRVLRARSTERLFERGVEPARSEQPRQRVLRQQCLDLVLKRRVHLVREREAHDRVGERDLVAVLQLARSLHELAVHRGAVGRPEIANLVVHASGPAFDGLDGGVLLRRARVGDRELGGGVAPDDHAPLDAGVRAEVGLRALHDEQRGELAALAWDRRLHRVLQGVGQAHRRLSPSVITPRRPALRVIAAPPARPATQRCTPSRA
jgi:hypothetical protein